MKAEASISLPRPLQAADNSRTAVTLLDDATTHGNSGVIRFQWERTLRLLPNDARQEWLFIVLDGKPNATKKRLIVLAASPEVGFLDCQQATVLISALGLEAA